MWHMARKFTMRVVFLPMPFLVLAFFFEYLLPQNALSSYLFSPFRMVCYGCYCIQAFFIHFIIGPKINNMCQPIYDVDRSCVPCELNFLLQDLPQQMLLHPAVRMLTFAFENRWIMFWNSITFLYQKIQNCYSWVISVSCSREDARMFFCRLLVELVGLYVIFRIWYFLLQIFLGFIVSSALLLSPTVFTVCCSLSCRSSSRLCVLLCRFRCNICIDTCCCWCHVIPSVNLDICAF